MLNIKEITTIVVITIILAFTFSLLDSLKTFLWLFLSIFIIILANVLVKKVAAYFYESEVEIKLWEMQRYGYKTHYRFKKPFPAGAAFPVIVTALSFGYLQWLACLVFDVKARVYRAARRHGLYRFSEMTEDHIGYIAAAGIFANLIFAAIGYFLNLPSQMNFVAINIYYAFFNLIPFSDLDGNKIFFGNIVLWTFLTTITLISLIAIFVIL